MAQLEISSTEALTLARVLVAVVPEEERIAGPAVRPHDDEVVATPSSRKMPWFCRIGRTSDVPLLMAKSQALLCLRRHNEKKDQVRLA